MSHDGKGSDNNKFRMVKKQIRTLLKKRAVLILLLRLIKFLYSFGDGDISPDE